MCLKQSFSYSKWVLQAILSLTVLETVFKFQTTIQSVALNQFFINNLKTVKVTKSFARERRFLINSLIQHRLQDRFCFQYKGCARKVW